MNGRRTLKSSVVMLKKTEKMLEEKSNSASSVIDTKDNLLNKKYNLRVRDRFKDKKINKSFDQKSLNNLKLSNKNNVIEINENTCAKEKKGKENKTKGKSKGQVVRQIHSTRIKSHLSPSSINFKELAGVVDVKNEINVIRKSDRKESSTDNKDIKCKKIKDKVPLKEIFNCHSEKDTDQNNVIVNKIGAKNVNQTSPILAWRKDFNKFKSNCGTKRKRFVDVYDISQDEDIKSCKIKHEKKKTNSVKSVKRCVNKKKCPVVSIKNAKYNEEYFNKSKPVQNRLIPLDTNQLQLDSINNKLVTLKVSNFPSDKKIKNIQTSVFVSENKQNCIFSSPEVNGINIILEHNSPIKLDTNKYWSDINNKAVAMNVSNTIFPLDKKANEINTFTVVHENEESCISCSPVEFDIISEHEDFNDVSAYPESHDKNNIVLNIVDEFEKSLLIPRMTSTPDSTVLIKTGTLPPQGNVTKLLDISHIISTDRKCLNVINTPHPFPLEKHPVKETDITLFESPAKKQKAKNTIKSKSSKESVQINLFTNFITPPTTDNLEDSVLKSKKAYHSPDSFKIHLSRMKRMSEVIKKEVKKSKVDVMIEKMTEHFDEISGTELCIE